MPSAAYYREWRKNHPEYQERERERRRRRRARMTPAERRKDRGRKKQPPPVVIPSLHQGHELFDEARRLAKASNGFKHLAHPYYDDLISELVLCLLEGTDPEETRRCFLRKERAWLFKTISLHGVVEEVQRGEGPVAE